MTRAWPGWTLGCMLALQGQAALADEKVDATCTLPAKAGAVLKQGPVQVAWRTEPRRIVAGQPFVLWLTLCPARAELRAVDATMPEHQHGMNYRPSLTALGAGGWRVEGLLWHMSGRWELRIDVQDAGVTHTLRHSTLLP